MSYFPNNSILHRGFALLLMCLLKLTNKIAFSLAHEAHPAFLEPGEDGQHLHCLSISLYLSAALAWSAENASSL